MWVVFFISSMAETFGTPSDLVEAENELVAGHETDISSMSFALSGWRICERDPDVCAQRDHLLGWVAASVRLGATLCDSGHPLAARKDVLFLLLLRLGKGDWAALLAMTS